MFNKNDQMRGLLTTFCPPNVIFPYSPNLSQHIIEKKRRDLKKVYGILLVVKANY